MTVENPLPHTVIKIPPPTDFPGTQCEDFPLEDRLVNIQIPLKFVVFTTATNERPAGDQDNAVITTVVFLVPWEAIHEDTVRKILDNQGDGQYEFVGAGTILLGNVHWGSETCLSEFKKDKPANHDEANAFLKAIQTVIAQERKELEQKMQTK